MSCVLRISGTNFDVNKFIGESEWKDLSESILHIYRKGEFTNKLKRKVNQDSGLGLVVSNADFLYFEQQQQDAVQFLSKYRKSLLVLKDYPIDNWNCLDFGVDTFPPNRFSRTYIISPELMRMCSEYNIEIWMSNYFSKKESRRKGRVVRKFNFKNKR